VRVALYARVSTKQHGQDVETQLQALRHGQTTGLEDQREYSDRGWSGTKEHRPELDRLMADAKAKKFDVIVFWRFDRFARSLKHLIQAADDLKSWGVGFVSMTEGIDTSTPAGRMVFQIFGAIAEFERNLIRERVQLGVDRARRDGRRLGRPPKYATREKEIAAAVGKQHNVKAVARQFGLARSTVGASSRGKGLKEVKPKLPARQTGQGWARKR
jgi:DNA invertase Pin-like site-specific DNA recombinase